MESPVQIADTFSKRPIAKLKILLAEDSLVNQKVMLSHLRQLGGTADVAADGQAVLESIQTTRYDIILMDCHMPGLDGYSTTKTIRSLSEQKQMVIIAMTATLNQGDWGKCLESGMDDYLNKPVQVDELAAKLLYWGNQLADGADGDTTHAGGSTIQPCSTAASPLDLLGEFIDWEYLHELSDGNEAFELELLETLLGATVPRLDILRASVAAAAFPTIRQEAHYIKGSTASVGIKSLEGLASRLEMQAEAQQLDEMDDLLRQIEQGFGQIQALIGLINP
jgi:CheY-like chemotaxis protein